MFVMLNITEILEKLYLAERFVQKVAAVNTVPFLTVNSFMDIFLQVLQNFQNSLQQHIFVNE